MGSIPWMTAAYFREELVRFREIMCSKSYTIAQKEAAFKGLGMAYLNLPDGCEAEVQLFISTSDEFQRRLYYEHLLQVAQTSATGIGSDDLPKP